MKGYKTVAFNAIMGVLYLAGTPDAISPAELTQHLTVAEAGFASVWTVGNIVLRAVTNSPIFRRN